MNVEEAEYKVRLTPDAETDLEAIYDYLLGQSYGGADALHDDLLDAILSLERMPYRNPVSLDLPVATGREYRRMPVKNYRVIYRVAPPLVIVFAIVHARRDAPAEMAWRLSGES